jgi:outer membrane protein assembly factor BamE (lipoprotein component of BamABCDE complex)|tara:strand:+ start:20 stop:484 length:465 start_codon:yes stop_codon:yes gene_type:complete
MKKIISFFLIFLFIANCTLNKVIKHHGVHFLEKKHKQLIVGTSNKNDIIKLLGPPSTKGAFAEDLWIYIEMATSSSRLTRLGKKTLVNNNVLILDINNKGLLSKVTFLNKDNMNKYEFSNNTTQMSYTKDKFIYEFLKTLRQKMNDPLGTKKIN